MVIIPSLDRVHAQGKIALLTCVGTSITNSNGEVGVRMPVGFDAFVKHHTLDVAREGEEKRLGRLYGYISDNQAAILSVF